MRLQMCYLFFTRNKTATFPPFFLPTPSENAPLTFFQALKMS